MTTSMSAPISMAIILTAQAATTCCSVVRGRTVLKGGAGIDTASFQYATADVTASLATGGSGGEANGDTYTEIENLLGSDHNDRLTGDDNANTLMGGAGNDTLVGGGGVDRLDGGAGSDTVSYAERAGPVTVDLANGVAPDGDVLVASRTSRVPPATNLLRQWRHQRLYRRSRQRHLCRPEHRRLHRRRCQCQHRHRQHHCQLHPLGECRKPDRGRHGRYLADRQ